MTEYLEKVTFIRDRYKEIMRRHVLIDFQHHTDDDLVEAVYKEYRKWRESVLVDPNE